MSNFRKQLGIPFAFVLVVGIFISFKTTSATALIDLGLLGVEDSISLGVDANEELVSSESGEQTIEVVGKQRGYLLALLPISFSVKARADANGTVELEYPWYSFLTIDNSKEVETRVRMAVDIALRETRLGSVVAEGESLNPQFSSRDRAAVEAKILEVLEASFESEETTTSLD